MLHNRVHDFIRDKRQRSEAYANTRRRGPLARPNGLFATATSLPELRAQLEHHNKASTKAEARQQLRITIRIIQVDIKAIDNKYKQTKKQEVNGKMKTLTKRQWLEHMNEDINYDMLYQSLEEHKLKWKG